MDKKSIDIYKIIGVSPTDDDEFIKRKCIKKLTKYHPDKTVKLLREVPPEEQETEKRKLLYMYKLIKEAYEIFKDPAKRKLYDLQRQASKSDFEDRKNEFKKFIELQEAERLKDFVQPQAIDFYCNENIESASGDIVQYKPLDKKEGWEVLETLIPGTQEYNDKLNELKQKEIEKMEEMVSDLEQMRTMQDDEYLPENLFGDKEFDVKDFNAMWEKKFSQGGENVPENTDIVKWEGVAAYNDYGMYHGQFSSLTSCSYYTNPLGGQHDILVNPNTKMNLVEKSEISKLYEERLKDYADTGYKEFQYDEIDLSRFNEDMNKKLMDNPFNISAQLGVNIGLEVDSQITNDTIRLPITNSGRDAIDRENSLIDDAYLRLTNDD